MKVKHTITLVVFGLAALLPLSCSRNFLNPTDTTDISQQSLFHTSQDGISLVNSIYNVLQHDNQNYVLKSLFYNANFLSQDFFNWGADISYNNYQFTPTFGALSTFWDDSYQGIARANSAFPIIAQMQSQGILTSALASRLTGEAYFLRGLFYYYLACTFGGVPLELKTVVGTGLDARSTQDSVFAAVVSDMTQASNLLPWPSGYSASDLGRATKGAALGYLGSAQMWLKQYSAAVTTFQSLISSGNYTLLPNYMSIHEYNNQNNAESLFEIQFANPAGGKEDWNGGNQVTWMSSFGMPEELTSFGYDYANPLLYTSFEAGDSRKAATIIGPGDTNASPGIVAMGGIKSYPDVVSGFALTPTHQRDARYYTVPSPGDTVIINTNGTKAKPWLGAENPQRSGYYGMKFWRDPNITGNSTASDGISHIFGDQNVILLRLGEIYLDLADAQAAAGDATGAATSLGVVRARAGLPTASPYTGWTNQIQQEYRHELGDEMSLWYDLRRNGNQLAYIQQNFGIAIPQGHDLLPIPAEEITSDPNIKQNPGY